MPNSYIYILLVYPLLLLILHLKEKLKLDIKKFNNILLIIGVSIFYILFSSPILTRVENTILNSLTTIIVIYCFRREQNIKDVFDIYTCYWLSIFSLWSILSFTDLLLYSGALVILRSSGDIFRAVYYPIIWLCLIFVSIFLNDLDIAQAATLRYWGIECFFLLAFFLFLPRAKSYVTLIISSMFLLMMNNYLVSTFGLIPRYFVWIMLAYQLLMTLGDDEKNIIHSSLILLILSLPEVGLNNSLIISLFAYFALFVDKFKMSDKIYRPFLVINTFVLFFIFSQLFSVYEYSSISLKISAIFCALFLAKDYLNRIKKLGFYSFEKSIPIS